MTAQIKYFPVSHISAADRFTQDVIDLFSEKKQGHMNKWCFDQKKFDEDNVCGSLLWDRVYKSEAYYLPEYDIKILQEFHHSLANDSSIPIFLRSVQTVYDLGPGSEECVKNKVLPILKYIRPDATYSPVDLSDDFLKTALDLVGCIYPKFTLNPCIEDFDDPKYYNSKSGLVTFFGSTIGNVPCMLHESFPHDEYYKFFNIFKRYIKDGFLIITQDTTQDPDLIYGAYTCPEFIQFAENLPYRIYRDVEIKGNFDPSAWKYSPIWRKENFQFAHRLVSTTNQKFEINGQKFEYPKGKSFISINSFKFPGHIMTNLAENSGYRSIKTYQNERAALHIFWKRPE